MTKYRYLILFLFSANFVISSILVAPFASYFKSKFGNSIALEKYDGYDLYAIGEFLNNYGEGFQPLSILIIIFAIGYFIFAVFANAGVLYAVISNNKIISLRPAATGAVNYFWKILRLSVYYLLAIVLILILVWKALLVAGINVLDVKDDLEIIRKMKWGVATAFILFALCSMMKQYAKVFIAIDKKPIISASILKSSKFVFRYILSTIPLYLLNIGFLALVMFLCQRLPDLCCIVVGTNICILDDRY